MCSAALSSLHVRARMGCASAASSASALACSQQLVAVPEERKGNPAQGDPTHPHQAPAGTMKGGFKPWFTIQDVLQQGKYFSTSVWAGFSPGKVQGWLLNCMGMHIHVQGPGPGTALQLPGWWASPHQPSTHGTVEALLLPCPEEFTQGRTLSLKHDITQLISLQGNVGPHCSLPTGSP